MSRYIDAEVALSPSSEQLPRDLPLGRYGFKSPSRNTTSSDQWRKSIRQQDTPVAHEKRSDASYFHQALHESDSEDNIINNGNPDDHPSQRRQQKQDRLDHESPRSRKRRQEAAQRVPVNPRQDSDYEVEDEEEEEDEDDGEGLDIGVGEDEQYYYQSPYPDVHDSEEEYLEEELTPEQLAFEEAERKREKEQIGFLERVTTFFWNQMDDIGATPKSLQQYHQLQQQQKNHANSDSDASAYSLTSARARSRKAPLKRRSKPGPFLVPSLPKRGSFNVPSMRHLDSGIGMTSWIDERRRSASRDGDIHQREQISRASVHVDQHSPQELYTDHYQKQQPVYQDDVEDLGYGRPRRRTPSKEYVRPAAEPAQRNPVPRVYPWHVLGRLMSIYTQRLFELYHAIVSTLEVYFRATLAWIQFAITWPWLHRDNIRYYGERFIRAGVETGLFRSGTLSRLALLGLVLLAANWIGVHEWASRGPSHVGHHANGTSASISQGASDWIKNTVSNTWSGITRLPSSQSSARQDTETDIVDRTWRDWVPHIPSLNHWIPSRSAKPSRSSNKIYIPTDQITSMEELESRIELIQQALEELGQSDDKLGQDLQDKFEGILAKVTNVDRRVTAVDGRVAAVDGRVVDMDGRVTAVDGRVIAMDGRVIAMDGRVIAMDRRVTDVDDRVTKADGRLSSTDQRLDKVSKELDSLKSYVSSGQWIEQTVLELVRDEIPKYLVVSRDPRTGKLVIPAEFWDTARSLFATQEQLQTSIQDNDARANKFLEDNERAMEALVDGRMTKVTRAMFLNLVRTEANQIWQGLEKNVVALLERQGKLQGRTAPSRAVTDPSRHLTDVERELISELIDEALEKYSADAVAKPDYALYSAGGRIIPRLTSPNYYHEVKLNLLGRLGFRFLVPLPRKEKPAEKAIEPNVHAGECWAMNGQEGQLAIRLARKIVVTEVTIEHADASVVLDMGSAPKEIEIWSLKGSEDAAPVSTSPATSEAITEGGAGEEKEPATLEAGAAETSEDKNKTVGNWWSSGIPWPGATLLDTIDFDANTSAAGGDDDTEVRRKPKSRQTFAIPLSKQTSPSVGVVLRIKSNWGHPQFTCVYRVRVHGYEPSDPSTDTNSTL
ncbi:hypothetical protein BG000_001161 [Podila horticola]|nr:hypothetical protein BG000_001161 [Podila horticola]